MRALAANGSFHVALLDGVTGSGKTEVYFEAIAEVIRRGKQSLILMPEIALTGQFLDRFAQRFGGRPLEWHSELTPRTRERNWSAISEGQPPAAAGGFSSPRRAEEIKNAVERREQALLFFNRRGYAPLTLCRACGHRFACTICDAWLVDHRFRQRLVCHHCGFSMPRPNVCPHCAAEESLVAVGPGVERLQEEAAALFPDARTMVLSSDLITSIETMRSELNEIAEGRVDIILRTQLVAKGHNFPRLNLVRVGGARLRLSHGH